MRILVTGCTGFVGSALVKALLSQGNTVYCASRSGDCRENHPANHLSIDLSRPFSVNRLPSDLEYIVHAAATMDKGLTCAEMFSTNVVSTLQLLEFGKNCRVRKFVFISSGAVYGYAGHPSCETDAPNPSDFYGASKQHSEMLVNFFGTCFSTSILRLFYPYGEGQTKGIIPRLYSSIIAGNPITIHPNDTPHINPIYISNVVDSIVKVMHSDNNQVLNISGNEVVTIRGIADLLSVKLGKDYDFIQSTEHIGDMVGSNQLLIQEIGFGSMVSLAEGLERFCSNVGNIDADM